MIADSLCTLPFILLFIFEYPGSGDHTTGPGKMVFSSMDCILLSMLKKFWNENIACFNTLVLVVCFVLADCPSVGVSAPVVLADFAAL